jgi:hypothetical protein
MAADMLAGRTIPRVTANRAPRSIVYGDGPNNASAPPLNAFVAFDANKSWVLVHAQDAALLEHERLHLRIGEYIATKVALNLPADMTGNGVANAATRQQAQKDAADVAIKDFHKKRKAFIDNVWEPIDKRVQKGCYDDETEHGTIPEQQAKWAREWQAYVDDELQKQGWKVR